VCGTIFNIFLFGRAGGVVTISRTETTRGWGEYKPHVWISDLVVRDTARVGNMGVWGDEGGQHKPEAIRVPRVEERLESLWTSSRVDALRNYQQTPRRRQHAYSLLYRRARGCRGRDDWRGGSTR
jgi:hypothetical protein